MTRRGVLLMMVWVVTGGVAAVTWIAYVDEVQRKAPTSGTVTANQGAIPQGAIPVQKAPTRNPFTDYFGGDTAIPEPEIGIIIGDEHAGLSGQLAEGMHVEQLTIIYGIGETRNEGGGLLCSIKRGHVLKIWPARKSELPTNGYLCFAEDEP
jgi:hypothetical protein